MVLNKIGHLARTSFGKTLTHLPQTVVAGTQSSYASTGTPFSFNNHVAGKFGKSGNAHLHTSFQNPSSPASAKSKAAPGSSHGAEKEDSGLTAYYDAWQKQHQPGADDKEWKQFQFTKRIGWKAPTAAVLAGRAKEIEELGLRPEARLDHGVLNRALTESAVQDLKQAGDAQAEAEALARVDEAIASEITQFKEAAVLEDSKVSEDPAYQQTDEIAPSVSRKASPVDVESPAVSTESIATPIRSTYSNLTGDLTAATSQDGLDQNAFSEQVARLSDEQRYAEIPPVFEAMLLNGVRPTIKAYNGLLSAVIHLPIAPPHQVVPKALNVYTDLLRRKVIPDTTFYAALIGLLSTRALDSLASKKALDRQRIRYGDTQGHFLFASQETEYDIVAEDDSLLNAIRIFDSSISAGIGRMYSSEMYRSLIKTCALYGKVDDMIRIVSHMDTHGVAPHASIYPPMIDAFAAQGDLASVVECYNGYKALAILENHGQPAIKDRDDHEVYAAVVKAYASCGRHADGWKFWSKIRSSYDDVDRQQELQSALSDAVVKGAVVTDHINRGNLAQAMQVALEEQLTPQALNEVMLKITIAAADGGHADIATQAFEKIDVTSTSKFTAAVPMLALNIRRGEIAQAQQNWSLLINAPQLDSSFAEATAHYATALINQGLVDDGLVQSREAFARIRSTASLPTKPTKQ
ncbi:pentatricopeptide repeat-containing protein 5 [Physcia stellaris]|nr:pentatricopeptide repeat-containing protein 5 [Physcia stellaris]